MFTIQVFDTTSFATKLRHGLTPAARCCRESARRLGTSAPQLYRLLDPTNSSKSINQLISLLHVLGCQVELKMRRRRTAA